MESARQNRDGYARTVKIRADCTEREIHNFWSHIHFHPTDAIEDDWGRGILDQVSQDGAAQYVRIYAMLEDIVSRDKAGGLTFDFRETDRRLDYLTGKGFRLLICFNFLPRAIAADPECMSWLPRYKGKHINTSKPADYGEWQLICRTYTEHLLERYGEETLAEWYFHCWNEPDFPDYFLSDVPRGGRGGAAAGKEETASGPARSTEEANLLRAAEEYEKLYDHFAKGVTAACSSVKIGGPSAALSDFFIAHFLRHVKEGKNWADGGKGSRIDFLSVHTYGAFPKELAAGRPVRVEDTFQRLKELENLAVSCGMENPEIVVDEWGLSTEGFTDAEQCPVLEFRNTEFYAAAYARLVDYYIKNRAPVSLQMICLSGQHNLKREFHGYRSFFTLHGFPKPVYNAYVLCARLGDRLLESRISGRVGEQESEDAVREGLFEADGTVTGVLPAMDEKGRVTVLLYRFAPLAVAEAGRLRERKARLLHVEVEGLEGEYRIRQERIDHENANSYTAWRELGGREDLDQLSIEWIRRAGRLKPLYPEERLRLDGGWSQDLIMTDNSVSLIEMIPVAMRKQ